MGPLIATTLTTPETRAISIWVGGHYVVPQWESVTIQDTSTAAPGVTKMRIDESPSSLPYIRDQSPVRIVNHDDSEQSFRGYVISRQPRAEPAGRAYLSIVAEDAGSLLDTTYIHDERRDPESDRARISYFWGKYAGAELSGDMSLVSELNTQITSNYYDGFTLREVIASVGNAATWQGVAPATGANPEFYVGGDGRLRYYDSSAFTAPHAIGETAGVLTVAGARTTITTGTADHNMTPGTARLRDGRMFMLYRKATDHDTTGDGKCATRYSTDNGASWGPEFIIYTHATLDVRPGHPLVTSAGTVIVPFFTWDGTDGTNSRLSYVIRSTDNGYTWGAPIAVTNSFTRFHLPIMAIEPTAGTILLTLQGRSGVETLSSCAVVKSTDDGVTWGSHATVANGPSDGREYQEPAIVAYDSANTAKILCMMRTVADDFYRSLSANTGTTWSAPVDSGANGDGIPAMVRLSGNVILMTTRGPGNGVYFTSADGLTWSSPINFDSFDNDDRASYAWPELLPDGRVLIVYSLEPTTAYANLYSKHLVYTIAPHDLQIDYESRALYNRVYVQGETPEGSGFFQDAAAITAADGVVRTGSIRAGATTAIEAQAEADAFLSDQSTARPRGQFSATSPDDGWRAGQSIPVTNAALVVDQTFSIARVSTSVVRPGADPAFRYTIEFGDTRAGA